MSVLKNVLAGTAGLAAVVGFSSAAAAQYYSGFGQRYGSDVGRAIDGVVAAAQNGYGQDYGNPYGAYGRNYDRALNSHPAVGQCARALEARGGYGGAYGGNRITGIRSIEPRNNGAVRVDGMLSNYQGYGYGNPNLTFSCKVDRYGRVVDLRVDRNNGYRNW